MILALALLAFVFAANVASTIGSPAPVCGVFRVTGFNSQTNAPIVGYDAFNGTVSLFVSDDASVKEYAYDYDCTPMPFDPPMASSGLRAENNSLASCAKQVRLYAPRSLTYPVDMIIMNVYGTFFANSVELFAPGHTGHSTLMHAPCDPQVDPACAAGLKAIQQFAADESIGFSLDCAAARPLPNGEEMAII